MFQEMGWLARIIFLTLMLMAAWTCWLGTARGDALKMRQRVRYLGAIGQTAPLLGFLGTAVGIINVMVGVARQAPVDQLSSGLSESLVTTVFGLLIGVAAHWTAAFRQRTVCITK